MVENRCSRCDVPMTKELTRPSWVNKKGCLCRRCFTEYQRNKRGNKPRNSQTPNSNHVFPCGCSGILPKNRGEGNKFARSTKHGPPARNIWYCRVAAILRGSVDGAKKGGYKPINAQTPHASIRKMMEATTCWRCNEDLVWKLGRSTTPHLHHNHETGEALGFTHNHCNPRLLELEIDRLKAELANRSA